MRPLRPTPSTGWSRSFLPPLLVFACAAGYVGIDFWIDELPEPLPGGVSPYVHAALVTLQAVALLFRHRLPIGVFSAVVLIDLVILGTTAGELGIGALAQIFGSYTVARHLPRRTSLIALSAGAAATTAVGGIAMMLGSRETWVVMLFIAVARVAFLYAAPAAVASYLRGRRRLAEALREQARMGEAERRDRAEREVRNERTALARELHDIAGHHLSGIIVTAQAATALIQIDPPRAREMMQTLQDDARTTLADLRRTVGLLRSDEGQATPGTPSPTPTIEGIASLVDTARERGQQVEYAVTGDRLVLGPLAETAAYRMVQESLANAARHAQGSPSTVNVTFTPDLVEITVSNTPLASPPQSTPPGSRDGYGLSGMAERAALIGARLTTGQARDGGWSNRLIIPLDGRTAP